MTSISSTSQTPPATASSTTGSMSSYNNLTEADFMKLLTTQLANQDPTSPVDNTQMLAQLAQFSTLAAANTTNSDLTTISGQIGKATGSPGIAA
jgi:flagellar basal-body rod modification protein FlgD